MILNNIKLCLCLPVTLFQTLNGPSIKFETGRCSISPPRKTKWLNIVVIAFFKIEVVNFMTEAHIIISIYSSIKTIASNIVFSLKINIDTGGTRTTCYRCCLLSMETRRL